MVLCAPSVRAHADEMSGDATTDSVGCNVTYVTQEEIIAYFKENDIDVDELTHKSVVYSEVPNTSTAPYSLGAVSDESLNDALRMLNAIRYVAGLDANVTLNDSYVALAQAAAVANAVNGTLSHYPSRPDGMDDELYSIASLGASRSNLSASSSPSRSLASALKGWMADGSSISNVETVGHRRWILNPPMGQTGFGVAPSTSGSLYKTFSSMHVFDGSNSSANQTRVAWPAQNMPTELFSALGVWSLSVGSKVSEDTVEVTLTRQNDGKTWHFSVDSSDGSFYVNNEGYGQTGCIVFQPVIYSYKAGDVFTVHIEGAGTSAIDYTVSFFDANPDPTYGFDDVEETDWVVTEGWLSYVMDNGLMSGYAGSSSFGPADTLSRAQVATILYRASVEDASDTLDESEFASNATPFVDNVSGSFYTAAINWAYEEGILTGDANTGYTTVRPADPITREDLVTMIERYCRWWGLDTDTDTAAVSLAPGFGDVDVWAVDGMAFCYNNRIITGSTGSGGNLLPRANATRAEMAKIITVTMRLLEAS